MNFFESFHFEFKTKFQAKNNPEKFCSIEIEATDKGALVNAFAKLIEDDKTGLLRTEIQKALLKANVKYSQN